MTREVPLTQGYVALVDDEDYDRVTQYKWAAYVDPYSGSRLRVTAGRNIHTEAGRRTELLHQFILGTKQIDHANHNPLDNRRENLRPANPAQNTQNSRKRIGSSSQFKGVSWHKREKKWRACIQVDGKLLILGQFTDEITAAHVYDRAACYYFGEFAFPNFGPGGRL